MANAFPIDRLPTEEEWREVYEFSCLYTEIQRREARLASYPIDFLEKTAAGLAAEVEATDPNREPWHYNYAWNRLQDYLGEIRRRKVGSGDPC